MGIAKAALDGIWNNIMAACQGAELLTPAERSWFKVAEVTQERIVITTKFEGSLYIGKEHFEGALHYLLAHGHHDEAPCEIRSNKSYDDAGPLCRAARKPHGGQMNITYVLPILKQMGLVGIDPAASPVSTAWYIA